LELDQLRPGQVLLYHDHGTSDGAKFLFPVAGPVTQMGFALQQAPE